jgi:hypothetical protein
MGIHALFTVKGDIVIVGKTLVGWVGDMFIFLLAINGYDSPTPKIS